MTVVCRCHSINTEWAATDSDILRCGCESGGGDPSMPAANVGKAPMVWPATDGSRCGREDWMIASPRTEELDLRPHRNGQDPDHCLSLNSRVRPSLIFFFLFPSFPSLPRLWRHPPMLPLCVVYNTFLRTDTCPCLSIGHSPVLSFPNEPTDTCLGE